MNPSDLSRLRDWLTDVKACSDGCPSDADLVDFVLESLEDGRAATVRKSVDECESCQDRVAELRESFTWLDARREAGAARLGPTYARPDPSATPRPRVTEFLRARGREIREFAQALLDDIVDLARATPPVPAVAAGTRSGSGSKVQADVDPAAGIVDEPVPFDIVTAEIAADGRLTLVLSTDKSIPVRNPRARVALVAGDRRLVLDPVEVKEGRIEVAAQLGTTGERQVLPVAVISLQLQSGESGAS